MFFVAFASKCLKGFKITPQSSYLSVVPFSLQVYIYICVYVAETYEYIYTYLCIDGCMCIYTYMYICIYLYIERDVHVDRFVFQMFASV